MISSTSECDEDRYYEKKNTEREKEREREKRTVDSGKKKEAVKLKLIDATTEKKINI